MRIREHGTQVIAPEARAIASLVTGGNMADALFRKTVEALPVAIYMTDAAGRLTFFNAAAAKLSGREPLLGTDRWCITWKLFLSDGTPLPHDQCPMAVALRGGSVPGGIECIAERPDGSRFWFTPYPTVLLDAEGRITAGINVLIDITDRKAAESEATEQFRAIVETTPECVKVVALDGTVLQMNSAGLEMIGATAPSDVVGKSVYDLIASPDRDSFRAFNRKICAGGRGSIEFDIVGFQGVRRHMETHAAPMRYFDGTTVHLAISRDITERKRTERAALLLSAIVESSDDAIISKDLNGVITSWNKSAERLFGYTAAEAVGRPVTILIPPDRLDEEPHILDRLRHGERVDHFETVRRRKDGSPIDISLTISPVRDPSGTVIGASKIARDITDRKLAETALLASEAKFRQLADSMPQIVWTARADGFVDYLNQRWYQFTGFSQDMPAEEAWDLVLHPDDVQRTRDKWNAALQSGELFSAEYRFRDTRENRFRWFMGRAVPVRDSTGNIVKWFGSSTDIDDQKRVEDDLRRSNEALEQFAFSASHDLQEPLRSVKIYSELLERACSRDLDGNARQYLTFMRQGATRMEMLVRDLLSYTQAAQLEAPPEPVDAGEALSLALANLSGAIAETGARVTSDPLPSLCVHSAHLQQLFQNLVGNALKYRAPNRPPEIHVTAEQGNGYGLFAVSDNGIGIDPQYKERIFGLFKRLHASDEYSGTGIGLAICQRIVDHYHGRIWVESEPGRGSTFRFTLAI